MACEVQEQAKSLDCLSSRPPCPHRHFLPLSLPTSPCVPHSSAPQQVRSAQRPLPCRPDTPPAIAAGLLVAVSTVQGIDCTEFPSGVRLSKINKMVSTDGGASFTFNGRGTTQVGAGQFRVDVAPLDAIDSVGEKTFNVSLSSNVDPHSRTYVFTVNVMRAAGTETHRYKLVDSATCDVPLKFKQVGEVYVQTPY